MTLTCVKLDLCPKLGCFSSPHPIQSLPIPPSDFPRLYWLSEHSVPQIYSGRFFTLESLPSINPHSGSMTEHSTLASAQSPHHGIVASLRWVIAWRAKDLETVSAAEAL